MDGKKTEEKKGLKTRVKAGLRGVKRLFGEYVKTYVETVSEDAAGVLGADGQAGGDRAVGRWAIAVRLLKKAVEAVAYAAMGYLFGSARLAYSSMPLGTALLAASRKNTSFIYIGTLVSAVMEKTGMALPLFLIYTALYVARILVYRIYGVSAETNREQVNEAQSRSIPKSSNEAQRKVVIFGESIRVRLVEGFSAALLISTYRAAMFGFLYYDVFGGLFEIAAVPILTVLYDFAFDKTYRFSIKREFGILSLLVSATLLVSKTYIFGFSLATVFVFLVTLYISKKAGAMRGGIYGLVCGFVCSPVFSPVFALSGMMAGALWKNGIGTALFSACLTGTACGIYVEGWESLTLYAPEIMVACILFFPFAQFGWLPKLYVHTEPVWVDGEGERALMLAEKRQRDTEERFKALSNAFSELSEVFYRLSDRVRRPGVVDAAKICDDVCDTYCPKCVFRRVCWEKEDSSTHDVFAKISKALCENGYVEKSVVDSYMYERCRHMDRMLDKINDKHARFLEDLIKQNKTEVFAMDYESVSHLLEAAVKSNCDEYRADEDTVKRISEAVRYMKIYARSVCVFGRRRKTVVVGGVDVTTVKLTAEEIRKGIENVCETRLGLPEFEVDGDCVTMTLKSERRFAAERSAASETKQNEAMSGDLVCMFENENDYFYSLISDGMGSGREAALTSRLCGVFLKKMLKAGNGKPIALEMLNNFIRSKNTECFSTVDLLEIDLINGRASFVKSGAAASYVKRGDKIFRIASKTMPVGITREINAEEVVFELEDGDVIVMVSDGVGQSDADTVRVSDVLTYAWEDDLQRMADKILASAVDGGACDDVSVGVIRVKEM